MKGTIRSIVINRNFGFIRANNKGDYFFHKDDFTGHWDDLVSDYNLGNGEPIEVQFEISEKSSKGPRASNVRRIDFPNQAV